MDPGKLLLHEGATAELKKQQQEYQDAVCKNACSLEEQQSLDRDHYCCELQLDRTTLLLPVLSGARWRPDQQRLLCSLLPSRELHVLSLLQHS